MISSADDLRPRTGGEIATRFILLLAFAATAVLVEPVAVQAGGPIGGWLPGPPMAAARDSHTATVLKDGRVLVVGRPGAEIYDPSTKRWSQAGTPVMARTNATATLLAGGRVLVAAGIVADRSVPNAEIYDPTRNAWSAVASMAGRRYDHTATLLLDGRVLIVGGIRSAVTLDSVEIYDPKTDAWAAAANLPSARSNHTAMLLPDGRVLVAGGNGSAGEVLADAALYDPVANTWSRTGIMRTPRRAALSARLDDGRILVVGGIDNPQPDQVSAEIFNPGSETWSPAGPTTQPVLRDGFAMTTLRDGRVLVCGGSSPVFEAPALAVGYVYDPDQDRWSATIDMAQGRVDHSASLLPDGRILVAGGRDAYTNGTSLSTTEIFDASLVTNTPAAAPATSSTAGAAPAVGRSPIQTVSPLGVGLLTGGIAAIVVFLIATALVRRGRRRV